MSEVRGKELADAVEEFRAVLDKAAAVLAWRHGGRPEDWLGPCVLVLAGCLAYRDGSKDFARYLMTACLNRGQKEFGSKDSEQGRQWAAFPRGRHGVTSDGRVLAELASPAREAGEPGAFWREATAGLLDSERQCVLAHYRDGRPYERIAAVQGRTRAAVDNSLRRALAKLRKKQNLARLEELLP